MFWFLRVMRHHVSVSLHWGLASEIAAQHRGVLGRMGPKSVGKLSKWAEIATCDASPTMPVYNPNHDYGQIGGIGFIRNSRELTS